MLIYKDLMNEEEICTDSHPIEEVAGGVIMGVQSRKVTIGDESFDIGANASAEANDDEAVEEKKEQVINLVNAHKLKKYEFGNKKEFGTLIKDYFKKLAEKLKETRPDSAEAFKKNMGAIGKWIQDEVLKNYENFDFYISENADLETGCMIIPARFMDDAPSPIFYYFKDGLIQEKF